jgi:hypothetical protein
MTHLRLAAAAILLTLTSTAHAAYIYAQPRPWGGSYIFIVGKILPGDGEAFKSLNPPPPVWVRPIGPGGSVVAALAIADIIHERGYGTSVGNNDYDNNGNRGCASACTIIWLSGYHVVTRNSSILLFHSCASPDLNGYGGYSDDLRCDYEIASHLQRYGYTSYQAWSLANASPHETTRLGTKQWAASLGFRWQILAGFFGYENYCQTKFCIAIP